MSDPVLKITPAVAWLSLEETARRSGCNLQRLRTKAKNLYSPRGLAEKRINPQTGQKTWFISEDADERFQAVRSAATTTKADLTERAELAADPVQREIVTSKQRILEDLQRQLDEDAVAVRSIGRNAVFARFARHLSERGIKGAERTLHRWHAAWLDAGRDLLALVDRRRAGERHAQVDDFSAYFDLLKVIYLDENQPAKSTAIRAANVIARRDGLAIPHEKRAQRHLLTLERINKAQVVKHRLGDSAFDDTVMPYIPRDRTRINVVNAQKVVVTRAMRSDEIWCADHHICDTLVEYKGKLIRPWLTAILDIRSGRIVGLHWSPTAPNKHNVLLAIRNAITRGGLAIPDTWYVDNGKDFDAWMFQGMTKAERRASMWEKRKQRIKNDREHCQGILELLRIKTIHAAPYNARGKPVERFFGIFEAEFGKLTYTYCGRNPQEKPEVLDDRLSAGPVPTFDDYVAEADAWIWRVHHASPLTSRLDRGLSRDDVYVANRAGSIRTCKAGDLDLLLMPVERTKVSRMGVTYRGFRYHDVALVEFIGQEVALKVDPADITSIGVWTLGMKRKIAQVTCLDLAAWGVVTDAQAKAVNQRIDGIKRAVRQMAAVGGVGYAGIDKQRFLAEIRREQVEQAPTPPLPPSPESIRMVAAPFDGPSNDGQTGFARPMKIAAGGEAIDLVSLGEEGL